MNMRQHVELPPHKHCFRTNGYQQHAAATVIFLQILADQYMGYLTIVTLAEVNSGHDVHICSNEEVVQFIDDSVETPNINSPRKQRTGNRAVDANPPLGGFWCRGWRINQFDRQK